MKKRIFGFTTVCAIAVVVWYLYTVYSVRVTVGEFGNPTQSGYVAQCTGDFPDWIVERPPFLRRGFSLSQDFPTVLSTTEPAPWKAFDPTDSQEINQYLTALLDYSFEGMPDVNFDPKQNSIRTWYHVPMMTYRLGARRREPLKGLTRERDLEPNDGIGLNRRVRSYAVGLYNSLGAYTLGQIWPDPDIGQTDPSRSQFPENTVVFKLIFLEYQTGMFNGNDILAGAPEWTIHDLTSTAWFPTIKVRAFQLDVAAKDNRCNSKFRHCQ